MATDSDDPANIYLMEDVGMPADLQPIVSSLVGENTTLLTAIGGFSRGLKAVIEQFEKDIEDGGDIGDAFNQLKGGIGYVASISLAPNIDAAAKLAATREETLKTMRLDTATTTD